MNIDEMMVVLQAAKAGKEIQASFPGEEGWRRYDIHYTVSMMNLRVKPEPMEIWVNWYERGKNGYAYASKTTADAQRGGTATQIRFREAVE